jgi:hypothetical protein
MCISGIATNSYHYFSNVKSMRLVNDRFVSYDLLDYPLSKTKHIQSLKKMVNLFYIKDLDIAVTCYTPVYFVQT